MPTTRHAGDSAQRTTRPSTTGTTRCPPPLRLALVWGVASALLGVVAVVLFFWTGWSTDSGMTCAADRDPGGVACGLYEAWAPVLAVSGVLAVAALSAVTVGWVTRRR